jgi:hypothetical protein
MLPYLQKLHDVLNAAEAVLAAREAEMLTSDEWDGLEHAVAATTEPPVDERDENFTVADRALVRRVVPRKGQPYEHRCPQEAFAAIAAAAEETAGGFALEDLRRATQLPWTQVAVAVAFLKERGCVVPTHGRKHAAASTSVYEDAMTEYHALHEET